ncbi:MAG: glutamate--tRNA ligase [Burkholderiaceae bacterium]
MQNETPVKHSVVRTRFAPSPTGDLHVGGARTALYCWAFARRHSGQFILRIEDTDLQRSTPQAVKAILDGIAWLGLTPDEEPVYQTHRMDRYREVIDAMLADGRAYRCYSSPEELEAMRESQRAAGLKPRYDGRWRPENAQSKGLKPEANQPFVIRFRNPDQGVVSWEDGVKGRISIANAELDDLVIARADGSPTYNFCVVVDDMDMAISHVIRGDDHINNTPRQINILKALGALLPQYAHLPMIHGPDGEKLSKRHGAVSVMQYELDGYLPQSLLNYLARLGWSHGDDEIFSMTQFCEWFSLESCSRSAAQFDFDKLKWLNNHYLREAAGDVLEPLIAPRLNLSPEQYSQGPALAQVIDLLKDRASTLNELALLVPGYYVFDFGRPEGLDEMLTPTVVAAIDNLIQELKGLSDRSLEPAQVSASLKTVLASAGLKMPQLAMPLRLILLGRTDTPSIDKVIALLGWRRLEDQWQGLQGHRQ